MSVELAPRVSGIIDVPADFARVSRIVENTHVEYSLSYRLNQTLVLRHRALSVRVSAHAQVMALAPIETTSTRAITPEQALLGTILKSDTLAKGRAKTYQDAVLVVAVDDVTQQLNNAEIRGRMLAIKANVAFQPETVRKEIVLKPVTSLKSAGKLTRGAELQIAQRLTFTPVPVDMSLQSSMIATLLKRRSDPSKLMEGTLADAYASTFDVVQGIERVTPPTSDRFKAVARSSLVAGKNTPPSSTASLVDTDKYVTVADANTNLLRCKKLITVPLSIERGVSQIEFVFDVIDQDGMPLETVSRRVNIAGVLSAFNTPKLPPVVGDINFSGGKAYVQVKQTDKVATSVQIWRKTVRMHEPMLDSLYEFVGQFPVRHGEGFKKFSVDVVGITPQVFRVIPVGPSGIVGAEFSNSVAAPDRVANKSRQPRANRLASCVFVGEITQAGISLEAFRVEPGPIGLRFLRRDLTLKQRQFAKILRYEDFQPISQGNNFLSIDTQVSRGHVYEYTTELVYPHGETSRFGSFVIEYIPVAVDVIDTRITELEQVVTSGTPDVKFKVVSTPVRTQRPAVPIGNVINQSQVGTTLAKVPDIVGFKVVRLNLTTGAREDMGTFTDSQFVDSKASQLQRATPLNENNVYRYQVHTLIRQADSLHLGAVTKVTDANSTTYSTQTWKFSHPVSMTGGNIPTVSSLATSYAKNDMEFGLIGDTVTVDVAFSTVTAAVDNVVAQRIDVHEMLIKWSVIGDHRLFDHFLVFREVMGLRSYAGKCHANFASSEYTFVHTMTTDDEGLVQYVVKPILNNYAEGIEKSSNEVEVDYQ